jgi:hypothetical protein
MAPERQRLSQRRKAAMLTYHPLAEHPEVPELVETWRPAGASTEDLESRPLTGKSPQAPRIRQLVSAERRRQIGAQAATAPDSAPATLFGVPAGITHTADTGTLDPSRPTPATVPLAPKPVETGWRGASSWQFTRLTRFARGGVLALIFAGGAVSVPLLAPHSPPTPRVDADSAAPVDVLPASDPSNSRDKDHTVPVTAANSAVPNSAVPNDDAASSTVQGSTVQGTGPSGVVLVPHATPHGNRTLSRPKPVTMPPPPKHARPHSTEADAWSRLAELKRDPRWARLSRH